jgi:hypothetical protein
MTGDSSVLTSTIRVKTGQKDWELKKIIVEDDWTFVTNNSVGFRGPYDKPGSSGEYADVRLHAGLVCVHAPRGLNLASEHRRTKGKYSPKISLMCSGRTI